MATNKKQSPNNTERETVSDAKKLADQHLADPHHIITEEDLAKVRVGLNGVPDEPTRQAVTEAEDRVADTKANSDSDTTPGGQKATPWDVINP